MNRLDRIHVNNVRVKIVKEGKDDVVKATIVLHDKDKKFYSEMSWGKWCNGGRDEIIQGIYE